MSDQSFEQGPPPAPWELEDELPQPPPPIGLDQPATPALPQSGHLVAPKHNLREVVAAADTPEQLGIPITIIQDLILKILFNEGEASLRRLGSVIKIQANLIDSLVEQMQQEHLVEVARAGGAGRFSYIFRLTEAGDKRTKDAFERSHYIGPAPVSLDAYNEAIILQTENRSRVSPDEVQQALAHLILPDDFHRSIGPAINEGSSLFLYGPPGNGKTTVAEAIGRILTGTSPIFLPYAVTVAGYIIVIHDAIIHKKADVDARTVADNFGEVDPRWGVFDRPIVIVGGELTMDAVELRFEEMAKFYEAPLQMKANGGMFLIDDFGRQQISPSELLNRWIVPLESKVDYLRLRSGQTMEIPFQQLIVFSTNLDPHDLVDDAFMRRIQMKVGVHSPDLKMFYQIFRIMAESLDVPFDEAAFRYLVETWYQKQGRTMQAVHPRDLIKIVRALCEYEGSQPHLSPELIDEACNSYFVVGN